MSGFKSVRDALDTGAAYEKALGDGPEMERSASASDWSRALVATVEHLSASFTPGIARDIFESAVALLESGSDRTHFEAGVETLKKRVQQAISVSKSPYKGSGETHVYDMTCAEMWRLIDNLAKTLTKDSVAAEAETA